MNIEYHENQVTAEALCFLQESVGFGNPHLLQAKKALENSIYSVLATVDGEIAGMGRLVGDRARIFYIEDIFIYPKYQGMGIGKTIVQKLIAYVRENAFSNAVTAIGLMAAKGKEGFYSNMGFSERPNECYGCGMTLKFNK